MRITVIVLLFLCAFHANAQNLPNFDAIRIESAADCKAAEPHVLAAANYLFATPYNKNDLNRLKSLQLIIQWMSATRDYTFSLSDADQKFLKGNDDLLGMYMGAMTRYVLGPQGASNDERSVRLNAIGMVLDYTDNAANNLKPTKNLRKLSEARAKGGLEKALESETR